MTTLFSESKYKQAAQIIKDGGLVAFRTETVYGLGADATNADAISKIYIAKNRPSDNPLIIHFHSIGHLEEYFDLDIQTKQIIHKVKGPITFILPYPENSKISRAVMGDVIDSVAVRIPTCSFSRKFIRACGVPIAAPSANTSTRPSPTRWQDVHADLDGKIAAILCGKQTKVGLESTVVKIIDNTLHVLRHGGVNTIELGKKVGLRVNLGNYSEITASPGTRHKHYSPKVPLYISNDVQRTLDFMLKNKHVKTCVLCLAKNVHLYRDLKCIPMGNSAKEVGKNLYSSLRDAEQIADILVIEQMPKTPEFETINERISKASEDKWV